MPQLVEYTNRENITPTDRGTEAFAQQGRRIGAAFNQVAESMRDFGNRTAQNLKGAIADAGDAATQYVTHREISQGVATYAQMQDTLTNQWNDIAKTADPNDPSVRQRFIEGTLTPALQKWGDSFNTEGGQKWAQSRTASLLDHMYEKTAADMSTMAGKALENNIRTYGITTTNTVYNDPSSIDHVLDGIDSSVNALVDSSPTLKGPEAAKARMLAEQLKEQSVKSFAQGAIAKAVNPEQKADEITKDPRYSKYITGAEAQILAGNARAQIRANNYDFETNRRREKEIATDKSNEASAQYEIDIRSRDPKLANDPTAKKIQNDPALLKQDRNRLLNLMDRQIKPETDARISATTTVDLLRKMRDPNANLDQLMNDAWDARVKDPGAEGSLTERDFNTVRNEIIGRKTPDGLALGKDRDEFFKRYIATIDPNRDKVTGLGGSALGDQKIYQAMEDAKRLEVALRAKGQDPHSLYDPASPNFFGKSIQKYRPTLQEEAAFKVQLKADQARKETTPPPTPTFNQRFGFDPAATVIKPPADREAGKTYPTPRGPMKWTGTGWVQP